MAKYRLDHGGQRPLRILTSIFLILVLLGFAGLMAADLIASREREIETVKRDSDNLAQVIERQVMTSVEKVDMVLRETVRDFTPHVTGNKPGNLLALNRELERRMQYTPEVQKHSLRIMNRDGRVVFNAGDTAELPKVFVGDRAYFLQQKHGDGDQLVISEPLLSRFTGKWLITLSRPMFDARGEFAGIVQMALSTEYFQAIFERIEIDRRANVSLFDNEWRLLSRHPIILERLGKQFNSPVRLEMATGKRQVSYEANSVVDGVRRLFVARKIEGMPYIIVIGRATEEFLFNWRNKAQIYAIGLLGLALALGSFLFVFYRHTEQTHQLVTQVFESASEAILITDAKGAILTVNAAFTDITGYGMDEVRGKTLDVLQSARHPDSFHAEMKQQIATQGQWRGEIWFRLKNGEDRPHLMSVTTLRDSDDRIRNCIGMFSDIGALHAARQDAEMANRAKGAFLATMSHEIRTPLNGVLGMAQMLLMPGLTPAETVAHARTILSSGNVLLTLLNDILDLSRVEAGKLELKPAVFKPETLLQETAALFQEMAAAKGLRIVTEWQGEASDCYEADATRLRQILANLVNNAIKFTAAGGIRIEGHALVQDAENAMLEFAVIDTGIGIPAEKMAVLFQPFSQLDSSSTRQYSGSGLGLSIVRSLAELMGGAAGCESATGQGARFWFRVRAKPLLGQSERRNQSRLALAPDGAAEQARILLVEDSLINQRVVIAMLERLGYAASCVDNGEKAVGEIMAGRIPDLIIMDCQMPVMDGFEATEKIRAWQQEHGQPALPIVALTAAAYDTDRERCFAAGMNEFMTKPVNINDLAAVLGKYLHRPETSAG